ncbi:MAG: fibronectin type III domain-containing protein [Nitrospirae bacterium]|nr:fibronectin type III domain-containing protein [Nitrospirota bacterium]
MPRRIAPYALAAVLALLPLPALAGGVTLGWTANNEPDLAGYRIHYGPASGSYANVLDVGNVTTAQVTGLTVLATYYFSVTAYDQSGNESARAPEVSALIPRTDVTPPVVTPPANIAVEATGPLTPVGLGTASAVDPEDGAVGVTASPTGPFAPGAHTVTWTATDSAGNVGRATQIVTVRDTRGPTIRALPLSVEATAPLTAVDLSAVTASDLVDGALTPTPDTTGPFARGTHTITWTATDTAGNVATAVQTVTITDTTPPRAPNGLTIAAQ